MAGERDWNVSRLFLSAKGGKKKSGTGLGGCKEKRGVNPFVVRGLLLLLLATATVFLAFPMPDSLRMGEVADRDVKADRDLMVKDLVTTKEKRESARRRSPRVFDLDDMAAVAARDQVHRLFSKGRAILEGPPVLSFPLTPKNVVGEPDPYALEQLKSRFNAVFNFGPEDKTFEVLKETGFSPQIERIIFQLGMDMLNQGIVEEKAILLDQPENGIIVRRLFSKQEDRAPFAGVFPSLAETRRLVRERALIYSDDYTMEQSKAIIAVAQALLRPNLVLNEKETEIRRAAAAAAVKPVFFKVKQGEMIIREGERVDGIARLKLEAQASKADRKDWLARAGGYFLLALVFLAILTQVGFKVYRDSWLNNRDFAFLSALLLFNLLIAFAFTQVGDAMARGFPGITKTTMFYLTPAAAGGLLAAIFLGPLPGIFYSIAAAAMTSLVFDQSLSLFLYCLIGTLAGLTGVIRVRERGAVIKSGLLIALANIATIVALNFMEQAPVNRESAFYLVAGLLGGVLSGVIVTGLIPLFEMIFRYTTNIKLLELANLDKPILRELMVQAPGSYHHSVIVGAMVEAAAEAIGANPLLAKVSAYYHDLGKLKKPLYFVENQTTGENKHEKLAPSMSSLILISHVKDGVELARKNKLSPEIIDIIQQHHGTSLIAYFYQKARDGRTDDQPEINIEDYRYPGPKPQTREAGLVMLADAVEAASRSIGEPNPARIQGMVQKIINNIFSDGQLDECELTLKDLHLIARSFNKILTGIFHRRISYPEPASKEGSKAKAANGNNGKQSPKDSPDRNGKDREPRKEDLKRLGMS